MADVLIKTDRRRLLSKETLRHIEFLTFSITVFAGKSFLLMRMPYREPRVNALYTSLILLTFYCYFRFRYRIIPPALIVLFLAGAVAVDVLGNAFNLYGQEFAGLQYDEFSHFVGSGLSLPPTMWLLRATTRRMEVRLPLDLLAFLSVSVTFSFCAYYEILELWDEQFYGDFQRLWTPQDSANDLQWDLAGIVLAALVSAVVFKIADKRGRQLQAI